MSWKFGHELVLGVHVRDKEHEPRPARGPTWGEQRQAERSGLTPEAAKTIVTEIWRGTGTGREFKERLEGEGFTLARGDRRDFVLIDRAGEVHSVSRRIEGIRAAEVRQRMADIDINELPDVKRTRDDQRQRPELRPVVPPEISNQPQGVSERLRADELRREREGKGGKPAGLSGSHGEIADAIYQLNKTMRGQVSETIVNSQALSEQVKLRAELAHDKLVKPDRVPAEMQELLSQPVKDPAEQTICDRNLIRPVVDRQQKTMDDVAAGIAKNLEHREQQRAQESWLAADAARRQAIRGTTATHPQMKQLDRELAQLTGQPGRSTETPTRNETAERKATDQKRERQRQGGLQLRSRTPRPTLNIGSSDRDRERE